jgi:hypothetical protein
MKMPKIGIHQNILNLSSVDNCVSLESPSQNIASQRKNRTMRTDREQEN